MSVWFLIFYKVKHGFIFLASVFIVAVFGSDFVKAKKFPGNFKLAKLGGFNLNPQKKALGLGVPCKEISC